MLKLLYIFLVKFHLPAIERLIINYDKHEEGRITIVCSCNLLQMRTTCEPQLQKMRQHLIVLNLNLQQTIQTVSI
jgi:hypothetical protein